MTHPHQLHARAALWSLRRSWRALSRVLNAMADNADRGTLQAWRGSRGSTAGASSPLETAILAAAGEAGHHRRVADRVREAVEQAYWLAVSDLRDGLDGHGQLARILAAIPQTSPTTARDISRYLAGADTAARRLLGLMPDHWPLPDNPPCPACDLRMLRVQVSAPDTAQWTVVCTARCRCVGDDCGCGMPVREVGVEHIWDRDAPLVAEQLGRLPRRRIRRRSNEQGA